jgi:ABC-type uncharacterized transport system permease subunit
MEPNDLKLITAVFLFVALVLPKAISAVALRARKHRSTSES